MLSVENACLLQQCSIVYQLFVLIAWPWFSLTLIGLFATCSGCDGIKFLPSVGQMNNYLLSCLSFVIFFSARGRVFEAICDTGA
jgi:hypothetical protein